MSSYNMLFLSKDEKRKGEDGLSKWWFDRTLGDKVSTDSPSDYGTALSYLMSKSYDFILIDKFKEPYNVYKSLKEYQQNATFIVGHERGMVVKIDNITDENLIKLIEEEVPEFDMVYELFKLTEYLRDIIDK